MGAEEEGEEEEEEATGHGATGHGVGGWARGDGLGGWGRGRDGGGRGKSPACRRPRGGRRRAAAASVGVAQPPAQRATRWGRRERCEVCVPGRTAPPPRVGSPPLASARWPAHAIHRVGHHRGFVHQPPQHRGLAVLVTVRLRQLSNSRTHSVAAFVSSPRHSSAPPAWCRPSHGAPRRWPRRQSRRASAWRAASRRRRAACRGPASPALLRAEQRHLEHRLCLVRSPSAATQRPSCSSRMRRAAHLPSPDQALVTAREGRLEHALGRLDGRGGALDAKCQPAVGAIDGVVAALPAIQRRGVHLRRFAAGAAWLCAGDASRASALAATVGSWCGWRYARWRQAFSVTVSDLVFAAAVITAGEAEHLHHTNRLPEVHLLAQRARGVAACGRMGG